MASVHKQRDDWADIHSRLASSTPGTPVTREDLYWAIENVRSRAFSGPYTGGSASDRIKLGLLLLVLAAAGVGAGKVIIEDALNGLIAAFGFNLLYDLLLSQRLKWRVSSAPPPPFSLFFFQPWIPHHSPSPPLQSCCLDASATLCHVLSFRTSLPPLRFAMCPFIDFMNHRSTVEVRAPCFSPPIASLPPFTTRECGGGLMGASKHFCIGRPI